MLRIRIFRNGWTSKITGVLATFFWLIGLNTGSADTQLTVTARNWNLFHSYSFYAPQGEFQTNEEAFFIPMVGGSATLRADFLGNSSMSLTVLHGQGDRKFSLNQVNFNKMVPFNASHINGYDKVERTDIEAIWQFPVGTQGASLFGGARYIGFQQDGFVSDITNVNGFDGTDFQLNAIDVQSYYIEFGGGLSDALDEDQRHLLFGNLTLSLGNETQDTTVYNSNGSVSSVTKTDDIVFGIDTNFGYALRVGDNTTLSSRYRLFIAAPTDNWSLDGNSVIHGPELQISHRF